MTKKVMLIDDSEIEIFISTKLLSISKVTTKISSYLEASEAVSHIYNHRHSPEHLPDYILLDIHMPLMNGFQFIKEIESIDSEHVKNIRIFILSSTADPSDLKNSLEYDSVKEVFSKPLDVQKLLSAIDKDS